MTIRKGDPFHTIFLKNVARQMQEYIDEGDEHITLPNDEKEDEKVEFVLPVRHAAQLFNDFLLYVNEGIEPPLKVKVPEAETE